MNYLAEKLLQNGIRLGSLNSGDYKILCPQCSHSRRNKTDRCLSVTIEAGGAVWLCHHCRWSGGTRGGRREIVMKKAVKPFWKRNFLPDNIIDWFKSRGIGYATLERNKISYSGDAIQFPYFKKNEVVNIKFRTLGKEFRQSKDAEKIFYGIDDIRHADTAIIVEGEIDKLSLEEAGFLNVLSVPDGAPATLKESIDIDDKKFEYIRNCWEELKQIKTFILAVDSDASGEILEEELARRLGRERCRRVIWPNSEDAPCKDANEVLMRHGKDALRESIEQAVYYPIENVYEPGADEADIFRLYREGYAKTISTGWISLDKALKVRLGQLLILTGIPGMGKSEWLDALMINLARNENWKFAICSFENPIPKHRSKLIEKYLGKPFLDGPTKRMNEIELAEGANWLQYRFHFMDFKNETPTIDDILRIASGLAMRYGIRGLIIDPYNEIEHKRPSNMTETEYVSQMLGKVKRFAANHDILVAFVAHPAKMPKEKDGSIQPPDLYSISGSANWVNKADLGIVIHRDPINFPSETSVRICKVRFKDQGEMGAIINLNYDKATGRYFDMDNSKPRYSAYKN